MEYLFSNPVSLWVVVLTMFGTSIASIALVIYSFLPAKPWHRILTIPASLMASALLIALCVWVYQASSEREIDFTQDCEVKLVTYPSGETVQMFYANDTNHNANRMFQRIVPEDSLVRRFVYKRAYHNIYFSDSRDFLADTYSIVKKDAKK